jgi:hypothetical protein
MRYGNPARERALFLVFLALAVLTVILGSLTS